MGICRKDTWKLCAGEGKLPCPFLGKELERGVELGEGCQDGVLSTSIYCKLKSSSNAAEKHITEEVTSGESRCTGGTRT